MKKKSYGAILVHGLKSASILRRDQRLGVADKSFEYKYGTHFVPQAILNDFESLPGFLSRNHVEVFFSSYPCGTLSCPTIESCSNSIREQIISIHSQHQDMQLCVVAYCLGGLVVRAYLESELYSIDCSRFRTDFIDKLILVGTPNLGLGADFFVNFLKLFGRRDTHQAFWELTDRNFYQEFNQKYHQSRSINYLLIGGTKPQSPVGKVFNWLVNRRYGMNDGAVALKSAIGLEYGRKITTPLSHSAVFGNFYFGDSKCSTRIISEITKFIKQP